MEFAQIFTEMHWVPALLLILGVVLVIIEIFVPGFGFFGISGFGSLIAGVIVRICFGLNLSQSLALVLVVLGFLVLVIMFMIWGAQYGILGKTGLFERRTTLCCLGYFRGNDVDFCSPQLQRSERPKN